MRPNRSALALQKAGLCEAAHGALYGVYLPYLASQVVNRQQLGMRFEYEAEHSPFDGRLVVHGRSLSCASPGGVPPPPGAFEFQTADTVEREWKRAQLAISRVTHHARS